MDNIKVNIHKSRNNITENSLNVYLSNIKKVFKELFKNDINILHFNKFAKVKKYLNTLTPATRKNVMTAIIVLLKSYDTKKSVLLKYEKYFEEIVSEFENNYDDDHKRGKSIFCPRANRLRISPQINAQILSLLVQSCKLFKMFFD